MTAENVGLGLSTIMNPSLAARYGRPYVELAAFAIDIDRARDALEAFPIVELASGWEIWLTEAFITARFDLAAPETATLLEDVCLDVFDKVATGDCLGAQLPFAVYDLLHDGRLPESLRGLFANWKEAPTALLDDLRALKTDSIEQSRVLDTFLRIELEPPFPELVQTALSELAIRYTTP